jgi:hypothetical protein
MHKRVCVRLGQSRSETVLMNNTHRTETIIIWPSASLADGGGTPMILVERVAHDRHC